MDDRIKPGHCWISGKPIWGNGELLPEGVAANLLLMDGKQCTIRVHRDHLSEINLNEIWKLLIEAERESHKNRPETPKTLEAHQKQLKFLCPPIGILNYE